MADLIERDALEAKIRENSMRISFFDPSVNIILHLIRYAPAVNRWIPCSERLPEEDVSVLCYMQIGEIVVMEYGGDGWHCGVTRYNPRAVTHWMSLPEPPESEAHDE